MDADGFELAQIALVSDRVALDELSGWYQRVFGFLPAGDRQFEGPELAEMLAVPDSEAKLELAWLVDRNDAFQLELFKFERPVSRPRPSGWTPRDIGYTLISLHVEDFDGALLRAHESTAPVSGPVGERGDRRAVVTDPNGVLLELLERDFEAGPAERPARPGIGVGVRSITASVPDLERSVAFFGDAFGLPPAVDVGLHEPAHESLWGLQGSERSSQTLRVGEIFLELVQYRNPAGAPWPQGHLLTDGGIMNIAFATADKDLYLRKRDQFRRAGFQSPEFIPGEQVAVTFVTDEQGFMVELLFMDPSAYPDFGFVPSS